MLRRIDDDHFRKRGERVLLIAYGCEPGRGSEAGIGWNHLVETARVRPCHVITHPRHREALDAGIADWNRSGTGAPMSASYIDTGGAMRLFERAGYFGFNYHYFRWTNAAMREAERLHAQQPFSLAQHASLTRWWMPTPAYALAKQGVPMIWGPSGAGECMPWSMRKGIGLKGHATEWSRAAARRFFSLDPRLKRCARATTLGLVEPRETDKRFRKLGVRDVQQAATLPADLDEMRDVTPMPKSTGTFRIVSGGGLVYWKGFDLSLRAFARAFQDVPHAQYVHASAGQWLGKMKQIAREEGIEDKVHLPGNTGHAKALRWVASADLYVLPTLRDTTGHIFESFAAGVPVLTLNRLSPGVYVDDTCGHRVSLRAGRETLIDELAATMRQWYDDPQLLARLSEGASQRAIELSRGNFGARLRQYQSQAIATRPAAVLQRF